jgi:hypothetical protein
MTALQVTDTGIVIQDVLLESRDVAAYFNGISDSERLPALERVIQVGVYCLERAQSAQDLDFVRRQVEGLLASVQRSVSGIPGTLEEALSVKLGTGSGQVLAPVKTLIEQVSKTTTDRINDVRALLINEIDPGKDSSTLGRALISLRSLLDPGRKDSVQGLLDAAIQGISSKDGTLATTVAAVVRTTLEPLVKSVDTLSREVERQQAAEDALAATTAKGASYEEAVVSQLQAWAKASGAEIHHVGPDNQAGDVIVRVPTSVSGGRDDISIVVEARVRQSPFAQADSGVHDRGDA